MPGGDLTEHIEKHPGADRLGLVSAPYCFGSHAHSRHQLTDVAKGLDFLHFRSIFHGDLRGVRDYSKPSFITVLTRAQPNILVDASSHARITGFCLAAVARNLDSMRSSSGGPGYTARWTAPEILNEGGTYSKEADVFSFAMVMIEVRHKWVICVGLGLPPARTITDIYRSRSVQ